MQRFAGLFLIIVILACFTMFQPVAHATDHAISQSVFEVMGVGVTIGQAGLPRTFWLAPIGAVLALVMAFVFYRGFMATECCNV